MTEDEIRDCIKMFRDAPAFDGVMHLAWAIGERMILLTWNPMTERWRLELHGESGLLSSATMHSGITAELLASAALCASEAYDEIYDEINGGRDDH